MEVFCLSRLCRDAVFAQRTSQLAWKSHSIESSVFVCFVLKPSMVAKLIKRTSFKMLSIRQPTKTAILEVVKLQSKTKSLLKSWGVFLFSNVLKTAVLWLFFLRWSSGRLQPWARWIKEALLNFDKNQDQDLNSYSVFTFCRDQGANIISRRQFFPSEIEENQGESPFSAIKCWGQVVFAPQS